MTRRKFKGAKRVDRQAEFTDEAFRRLTEKLYRWLILQPEWVHVLAAPRQERKRYGEMVADAVSRIPPYVSDPDVSTKKLLNLELPGQKNVEGGGSDSRPQRRAAPVASEPPSAPPEEEQ